MFVAAKVMGKVLMQRISDGIDAKLRKEQAGFRRGRSTQEPSQYIKDLLANAQNQRGYKEDNGDGNDK